MTLRATSRLLTITLYGSQKDKRERMGKKTFLTWGRKQIQIQEAHEDILIKISKTQDKERILKLVREKQVIT